MLQTLTATSAEGWRFDHWEGHIWGWSSPASITMNNNKTVTAVFVRLTYTLTTGVQGTGTISPATGPHNSGDEVSISATAGTGYVFHHWSGSLSGSANPTSITMTANKSVTAVFVQNFTLTTSVSGSGSGSIAPSGGTYAAGTPLSLTPTAAPGSRFDHWEGALSGSAIPAPLTMDANKSVTAVFVRQYTLNTSVSGTGNGSVSPAGGTYDAGAQVTLTAAPVSGSRFVRWEGDFSGTNSAATFTINADMNVTAVFDLITYTLTTGVLGEGSMLPPIGTYTYNEGTQVLLFPLPDPGWRFDHWEGGLGGNLDPGILIMNSDNTVTAVFEHIITYTLTVDVQGTGTGTVSPPSGTYNAGAELSMSAIAGPGCWFAVWGDDLSGSENPTPLTMNANKHVTAYFVQTYTLTTTVTGNGSVSPSDGAYDAGAEVTLTAAADPGWRFDHWEGDLTGSTSPAPLTMDANKNVTAVFQNGVMLAGVTFGGSKCYTLFKSSNALWNEADETLDEAYSVPITEAYKAPVPESPGQSGSPEFKDPICVAMGSTGAEFTASIRLQITAPLGCNVNIVGEGGNSSDIAFETPPGGLPVGLDGMVGPMEYEGFLGSAIGSEAMSIRWEYSIGDGPFEPIGISDNPVFRCFPGGPKLGNGNDGLLGSWPTALRMYDTTSVANGASTYSEACTAIASDIDTWTLFGAPAQNSPPVPATLWGILDRPKKTFYVDCLLGREMAYQFSMMLGVGPAYMTKDAAYASTDYVTGKLYNSDVTDPESEPATGIELRFSNAGPNGAWSQVENCLAVLSEGEVNYISVKPASEPYIGQGDTSAERRKHALYKLLKALKDDAGVYYLQRYCHGDGVGSPAPTLP